MGYGNASTSSNATLWEECLTVAVFARRLSKMRQRPDSDVAYTIGLLQNIGHIVLDRYLEEERDSILAQIDKGATSLSAERQVLGVDHATCGARIVQRWKFPDILVRGIRFHHEPSLAREMHMLCKLASLAEALACQSFSDHGMSMLHSPQETPLRTFGLDSDALRALIQDVRSEVQDTFLATA